MHHARRSRQDRFRPKLIALSVAACFSLSATQTFANPTNPTVVSGSAGFATAGSTLTVTNSANAIINWQGFSINVGEITQFLQSSAASAVLNRVVGSGGVIPQSVIDGMLSSNGRVFLLNSSGIVVGKTGTIDVAGLVMSSLNLSDQDFQNGRMHFTEVPGAGGVVNNGIITAASGGRVFLVAPDVENVGDGVKTGVISAPNGQIVLAAGKSVDLVSEDSPFVTVKVTADSEQALNLGSLIADGGRIDMSGALVRNAGVVAANSAVVGANGEIRLVATKDLTLDAGSETTANGPSGGDILLQAQTGTNLISGTVEAKGSSGTGGTVQALGVRVGFIGNGVIDASGQTGGGTVLVGGDQHGANPGVQNAQQTYIGPDGVIRADAQTTGDGGRVVVWSDDYTQFYGSISARGGAQGGNGGSVETSGANLVVGADARVDTSAPGGASGTWLLDPTDINIVATDPLDASFTSDLTTVATFAYGDIGIGHTSIDVASINNSFGTVTLQATHDINFNTSVSIAYGGAGLTAQAGNNIALNSSNIATNGGAVSLTANDNSYETATGSGSITSNSGFGNISANGGSVTLSGVNVQVGNINTVYGGGASPTDTFVNIGASGTVTTGTIRTGDSSYSDTSVYVSTDGSITTQAITTGNTSYYGSNTSVTLLAGAGIAANGDITTGTAGSSSYVDLETGSGGISTGNILTGPPVSSGGGGDSSVYIYTGSGNIGTGSITTSDADLNTYVYLETDSGSIVTHAITTGNTSSSSSGSNSYIYLNASGSSVSTSGGALQTGNTDGGEGYVQIVAGTGVAIGGITTGSSDNGGGSGNSYVSVSTNSGNLSTGAISTGTAGSANNVSLSANSTNSGVAVNGAITTASTAYGQSYVNIHAGSGGVVTGNIATGSAGSSNSYVNVNAYYGGSISTGAIATGAGGSSNVSLNNVFSSYYGGSIHTGAITTGNAGSDSYVQINSGAGIATGNITTGSAVYDSDVDLETNTGGITTGNILTGPSNNQGNSYSGVYMWAGSGDIGTGTITTGSGVTYSQVFIQTDAGNINAGAVTTGIGDLTSMFGDTVTWTANSINNYSITANTLFNWATTGGAPADVTAQFFTGISAPFIRIGNSSMTGNITIDTANSPITVGVPLSLVTTGSISGSGGNTFSAPNLNADGLAGVQLLNLSTPTLALQGRSNGAFNVTNTGDINIQTVDTVSGATTPAGLTAGAATLTAGGGITQTSPISVGNTLTVYGGTDILLGNALNSIPQVAVGTPGNAMVESAGGLNLLFATANGLSLISGGAISVAPVSLSSLSLLGSSLSFSGANTVGTLVAVATSGGLTFVNNGTLNASIVVPGAVSLTTTSGDIAGLALGSGMTLNAAGAIGSPSTPFTTATGALSAQAANGINIDMTSIIAAPVPVSQLKNTGTGDILLNAHGGVITNSLVSNPGGNVTINTFSPMTINNGISAGGSIFLSTAGTLPSGSPPNDMTLDGPFTYSGGAFEVTIGASGTLDLVSSGLLLTAQLFPNPLDITKFTFITSALPPAVDQAVGSATNSTNNSTDTTGALNPDEQKKKDDDKKGAAVCK